MDRKHERDSSPDNIVVILHRPAIPENIGAVARVLFNTGFSRLFISCPETEDWATARKLAVSAEKLLEKPPIYDSLADALTASEAGFIIGMTARHRKYWDRESIQVSSREIVRRAQKEKVAIVFGPENSGLSNEDLTLCSTTISIPAAGELASYNLSHAAAIVLFHLMTESVPQENGRGPAAADFTAMEGMYDHMQDVLAEIGFLWEDNPDHMMRLVRSFIGRTEPTAAETAAIRGICRRILNYLRYGERK